MTGKSKEPDLFAVLRRLQCGVKTLPDHLHESGSTWKGLVQNLEKASFQLNGIDFARQPSSWHQHGHHEQSGSPNNKRAKSAADDLTCPITLELPLEPVIAEDGRVYERAAIERYFLGKERKKIRSPYTNKPMGTNLLKAPQLKNLIETLVEHGIIKGDLAVQWNQMVQQKQLMDDLLHKSEEGNQMVMLRVARNYRKGEEGFEKDEKMAYMWYRKAHFAGSPIGTAYIGYMRLHGSGVARNRAKGLLYLGMAQERGSNWAAYLLGKMLADGEHGISMDLEEARQSLERSLDPNCKVDHMGLDCKKKAKKKLEEIRNLQSYE